MHQTDEIRGSGCELAMASQWTIHQLPLGPLGHGQDMAKAIFPKGIRFAQHHETYGGLDPQQKPEDFGWFGLYIEDSLE